MDDHFLSCYYKPALANFSLSMLMAASKYFLPSLLVARRGSFPRIFSGGVDGSCGRLVRSTRSGRRASMIDVSFCPA